MVTILTTDFALHTVWTNAEYSAQQRITITNSCEKQNACTSILHCIMQFLKSVQWILYLLIRHSCSCRLTLKNRVDTIRTTIFNIKQVRQYTNNVILMHVSLTTAAVEKGVSITYSECVFVASVIENAKRMRCIILSSVACLAVQYFSTLSHKLNN